MRTHEEGLAIRRKTKAQRADLTGGLNNLARAYQNLGRHDRFYALIKETVEVAREENDDTPVPLNNWGVAQRQQGELSGALGTMEEALSRAGKVYAKGHVNLAHYRSNLALVLMDLGRYREAERRLQEGREILEKKLPAGHWLLRWNDALRGECRLAAQDVGGARKLAEEAFAALEKEKQATVTAAMGVLGRAYLAQGEVEQAVRILTRLVEMERKPSAFHDAFTVAYAEGWLAKALRKAGRLEEAGKLRASAEAVLARYPDHARLRAAVMD